MNIQITGEIIGLKEDWDKEIKTIKSHTKTALNNVGADMVDCLQAHIQKDWYEKYNPKIYERRTDDTSLGTPIGSSDKEIMNYSATKNSLDFIYTPTGQHQNEEWHDRDGDELIKWLQEEHIFTNNPYNAVVVPARTFWDNFVEEEKTRALDTFIRAMKDQDKGLNIEKDINETLDLEEYKLK